MSRRPLRFIMLLLAMNAAILTAVVLLFTYGVRDAIVFVGIAAMLVLAYLLRRRARAQLLYTDDAARRPAQSAGRETETGADRARSNGHADDATAANATRTSGRRSAGPTTGDS